MFGLRFFRSVTAFLCLMTMSPLAKGAEAANNTNQCIQDLGGIFACQDRNALGLPNDLQACCDGVRQLSVDSCHCNPAIDNVLGEPGQKIYQLEALCRIAQPTKWGGLTPFFLRKCEAVQTHSYGCEKPDVEIDGERLNSILNFQKLFGNALDEKVCLDEPAFQKNLTKVFTPDVAVTVPYGIGTYEGPQNVGEYLGMAFPGMTHGFWSQDTTPDTSAKNRLEVSSDGLTWVIGASLKGSFMRDGRLPYTGNYIEQEVKFRSCETLISSFTIAPNEGMNLLITRYVQAADLSKRWGVEDICRYHTQYCADDPTTRQYASEEECRDYIRSLPLYTPACGPNRPLSGHSLSCKFKHHFMIPANPKMHCAHIGPKGSMDSDHHMKCDDETECAQDQGQDSWPPIQGIGAQTPADVRKVFEDLNPGYENEPFGCVIPSEIAPEGSEMDHSTMSHQP